MPAGASLQQSAAEKANHQSVVGRSPTTSSLIEPSTAGTEKARNVATTQSATVRSRSPSLEGFKQNLRTKSQYPEAPHAEANSTTAKNLMESPGVESPIAPREGINHTIGVAARFHDLRRSAVRNMLDAGMDESKVMRIVGHKTRATIDRYRIVSVKDVAQAGADQPLS